MTDNDEIDRAVESYIECVEAGEYESAAEAIDGVGDGECAVCAAIERTLLAYAVALGSQPWEPTDAQREMVVSVAQQFHGAVLAYT